MAPRKNMRNKRNTRRNTRKQNTKTYTGRKNFAMKRQAIVETKKNTEPLVVERIQPASYGTFIPVSSFLRMNHGIETDQFQGDSVFSKYISMKLNFRFPKGLNAIVEEYRIQVIHGWMTAPFALDANGVSSFSSENVSRAQLDQIVAARCGSEFDQAIDRMNFRDKTKKVYRVEGKKWVTLNRNGMIGTDLRASSGTGGPPDYFTQLNWKPMRKVNYIETSDSNSTAPPVPFHYPNEAWVPFVCIYTPDKDNLTNPDPTKPLPEESKVLLQAMNCHWYTDS